MENRLKFKNWFIGLIILLVLVITFNIFVSLGMAAYAETPNSTNVLSDLQKDPNFKIEDYRDKSDDHSIKVIQIAESTAKELLIYTYQPCQRTLRLTATSVNMSLSEKVTGTNIYNLELVSEEGVFCKYKVKDLKVSNEAYRYYNITSIYRTWINGVDSSSGNDNTINEIAYEVGRLYKASTIDGKVTYSYEKMETIEIVNPYVGFLHYSNGFKLYLSACHSHFIAFDTNKQIDELMEADVSYESQNVIHRLGIGGGYEYGESLPKVAYLKGGDKGETPADGLFSKKYEWERIEKTEDFIENEDLTTEAENELKKTKWVLRFVETPYIYNSGSTDREEYTKISNETILRLKFRTGIKIYDLGVVSNKITGDNVPDNNNTNELDPLGWLWRKICELAEKLGIPVWLLLLMILLPFIGIILTILSIIFPVVRQALKFVLKVIVKVIEWILKALIWIIELPFKAIVWIINKCKGGGSA